MSHYRVQVPALVSGASTSCGCSKLARRPIRVGSPTLEPVVIAGVAASLYMRRTNLRREGLGA